LHTNLAKLAERENLSVLYEQFLRNESSPEDISRLIELFGTSDYDTLQDLVRKQLDDPHAAAVYHYENEQRYARIYSRLEQKMQPLRPAGKLWPKIYAAASLVLLVGIGVLYHLHNLPRVSVIAENTVHKDVKPGRDKAFLILSDGQTISLAEHRSGLLGKDAGMEILKTAGGKIEYIDRNSTQTSLKNRINILRTPMGGRYRVVLPDGTEVWLNAASQLTYPANFKDQKERKVELQGEAYIEVAKDPAHPFIVQTDDQQIRVLGTHFNVNAYHDDGGSKTTLLEGSISAASSHSKAIIEPGQQVVSGSGGTLKVVVADIELAVAWKNDQFMFESEPIKLLMKKVARWYDVDVIYGQDVPDVRFNGSISKFANISAVLKILESTGKIHFEVSGRKVYLTKKR
jgi:transmembrane sensor